MMIRYRRVVLFGTLFFAFFITLDWIILPNRQSPRIESPQTPFILDNLNRRRQRHHQDRENPHSPPGRRIADSDLEKEDLLPVWGWFPGVTGDGDGPQSRTDIPEIAAMKKTLATLNNNRTLSDDARLLDVIRKFWLRPPSLDAYNLNNPNMRDFSKGQSAVVDDILNQKEHGFFVECGALDGETRSNTLFFERERAWTGLLIEAGPLNYRKLVKKNRQAYSTPACLGVNLYPNKMYFHRGENRGRLIDGKEALEWIQKQAMKTRLMEVQCFPLFSLLMALNRTHIDYFSLDVEGVELEVLQTIPWEHVNIEVVSVEYVHNKEGKDSIRKFMERQGYAKVSEVTRLDGLANDFIFRKTVPEELQEMQQDMLVAQ